MNKRKLNVRHLIVLINITFAIALIALIPILNHIANASRVKPAFGGECIVWVFPIMIAALFIS